MTGTATMDGMVIWSNKRWTIGLILRNGIVVEAPPIARKWALGRSLDNLRLPPGTDVRWVK